MGKQRQTGLKVSMPGSPPTMSTVKNSDNYETAETVIAFKNSSKSKLLTIAKKNKDKNLQLSMFAVLGWLFIESRRKVIEANEEIGPNEIFHDDCERAVSPSPETTEVLGLLNFLCEKNQFLDTSFFEKAPMAFGLDVFDQLKQIWLENLLQEFYPNSYYFHGGMSNWVYQLKLEITLLHKTFSQSSKVFPIEIDVLTPVGVEYLDRVMSFVYAKEANKRGGQNQIARFKAYQLFMVVFCSNYDLPKESRLKWQSRLNAWINMEQYIASTPKTFEKKTKVLRQNFSKIVTYIEDEIAVRGNTNNGRIESYLKDHLKII